MKRFALSLIAASLAGSAIAQAPITIERVKMTDNDLTCQQIYQEITLMDSVIARANQPAPAPAAPAAAGAPAGGDAAQQAAAGVAGAVAQQALATAAARTGFGGFGGFGGGGGGGLFGNLLGQATQAAAQQQAAQQAAAQAQAAQAQQAAAAQASQGAVLGQQAQGRKDHLTQLFLGKGCKMSDIQK